MVRLFWLALGCNLAVLLDTFSLGVQIAGAQDKGRASSVAGLFATAAAATAIAAAAADDLLLLAACFAPIWTSLEKHTAEL